MRTSFIVARSIIQTDPKPTPIAFPVRGNVASTRTSWVTSSAAAVWATKASANSMTADIALLNAMIPFRTSSRGGQFPAVSPLQQPAQLLAEAGDLLRRHLGPRRRPPSPGPQPAGPAALPVQCPCAANADTAATT